MFFFDKKKKLQIVLCHKRIISLKFKISKIPNPTPQMMQILQLLKLLLKLERKKVANSSLV